MMKFLFAILFVCINLCFSSLVPTPLLNQPHSIQRFNWSEAHEHLNGDLFGQCWGISKVKIRNQDLESWLIAVTDDVDEKIVLIKGVDSLGQRYGHWIKKFGHNGNENGEFCHPHGITIDTTIFCSKPDSYYIYIAESGNNRISRLFYDASRDSLFFYDYIDEDNINQPEDVECISVPNGGSYLVVADSKNNRIRIHKIETNLNTSLECTYGSEGSGTGQFKQPQSICIVPCTDSTSFYRIYVADLGNCRIVSILYNCQTKSVSWERVYSDNQNNATFWSITSNPYYCVYVTDRFQHRIWVFCSVSATIGQIAFS